MKLTYEQQKEIYKKHCQGIGDKELSNSECNGISVWAIISLLESVLFKYVFGNTVKIDSDVNLPGVNFLIIAPKVNVIDSKTINITGKNGESYTRAKN